VFNPIKYSALARRGGAIVFVAAFVTALAIVSKAEAGEPGAWVVASAEGAVTIEGKAAGSMGATIGLGTVIETGADGSVVLTRPGDSITIFPNSTMSVPEVAGGAEPGVLQTLGKLLFRMESRESRDFNIETPYLAAAIKGTTFTVEVDDDDAVVEVLEGSVLVTANRSGQSTYVGAGERAGVAGDRGDAVQVSKTRNDDGEESETGEAAEANEPDERDESDSPDSPDSRNSPDSRDSPDSPDSPDGGESDERDEKDEKDD
jgi:uncharacterized cupin superfamily protein